MFGRDLVILKRLTQAHILVGHLEFLVHSLQMVVQMHSTKFPLQAEVQRFRSDFCQHALRSHRDVTQDVFKD
jgi:hypothetical protein